MVSEDEGVDFLDQVLNAGKRTPSDGAFGDDAEEDLHLVKPRGIGWGKVEVEAGMAGQPDFNLGVFMGGVVVHDDMEVEFRGRVRIDLAQKGDKLLMPVSWFATADDLAAGHVQGGKERGGAVPAVIVSVTLSVT